MNNYKFYTKLILFVLLNVFEYSLGQDYWIKTNGPYGGNIKSIALNNQGNIFTGTRRKLYRFNDEEKKWTLINKDFNWIMFPALDNPIIFSIPDKTLILGDNNNIYRSSDSGENWIKVYNRSNNYTIAIEKIVLNKKGDLFACGGGIYRSTDNGRSWVELKDKFCSGLVVYNDSLIIVHEFTKGISYSTNNGIDWVATGFLANEIVKDIAKDSTGALFIVAEFKGIYLSKDSAKTWISSNNGLKNLKVLSIAVNSKNKIFVGSNSDGVYYSTDGREKWNQTSLMEGMINTIFIDSDDNIYAGTEDLGICYSSDGGTTWIQSNQGIHDWAYGNIFISSIDQIYVCLSVINGFVKSHNIGVKWEQFRQGLPPTLAFGENKNGELFIGTLRGIYKSIDSGSTWIKKNNG